MPNKLAAGQDGVMAVLGGAPFCDTGRGGGSCKEGRIHAVGGERDGLEGDGQVASHDGEAGVPAAHPSTAKRPAHVMAESAMIGLLVER